MIMKMAQRVNSAENEASGEEKSMKSTTVMNYEEDMDIEFSDFGSDDSINDRDYFPSSSDESDCPTNNCSIIEGKFSL